MKYSIHEFVRHSVSISATNSYISKQVEIHINENSVKILEEVENE